MKFFFFLEIAVNSIGRSMGLSNFFTLLSAMDAHRTAENAAERDDAAAAVARDPSASAPASDSGVSVAGVSRRHGRQLQKGSVRRPLYHSLAPHRPLPSFYNQRKYDVSQTRMQQRMCFYVNGCIR